MMIMFILHGNELQMPRRQPKSKSSLFLKLANPDKEGFSRKVLVSEFKGPYKNLKFGNGANWARSDGSLGQKFNVVLHKEGKGNAITAVELQGYNKRPKLKPIGKHVRAEHEMKRCVVLATGNVQIDHKDGRYDDPSVSSTVTQKPEDFQPLSAAANYAKREHCRKCEDTGKRFDARRLGYEVGQVKGNGLYRGTCVGCYWYDPLAFNAALVLKRKGK